MNGIPYSRIDPWKDQCFCEEEVAPREPSNKFNPQIVCTPGIRDFILLKSLSWMNLPVSQHVDGIIFVYDRNCGYNRFKVNNAVRRRCHRPCLRHCWTLPPHHLTISVFSMITSTSRWPPFWDTNANTCVFISYICSFTVEGIEHMNITTRA